MRAHLNTARPLLCKAITTLAAGVGSLWLAACEGGVEEQDSSNLRTYGLSIAGAGFDAFDGLAIEVGVYDRLRRNLSARRRDTVENGLFQLALPNSLTEAGQFYLDLTLDANRNGTCDPPMADRNWTIPLDNVQGRTNLAITFAPLYSNPCARLAGEATAFVPNAILTGKLMVATDIDPIGDFVGGQPLAGGTVFLEGFPGQAAVTDDSGNFALMLALPDNRLGVDIPLIAYGTIEEATDETWPAVTTRLGRRQTVLVKRPTTDASSTANDVTRGVQAIGDVFLLRTKGVDVSVTDAATGDPLSSCWPSLVGIGFQIRVRPREAGKYFIEYLPPGDYNLKVDCAGYTSANAPFTISSYSEDSSPTAPPIEVALEAG